MVDGDLSIDPWSSTQSTDYSRIIEQFGLSNLGNLTLPNPSHLHRRGIVFAHRDLELVLQAQKTGDKFGVLTGLMPSGRMHLGHSMVIEQVKWFQNLGGDVTIAVADLESQATRGVSLSKGKRDSASGIYSKLRCPRFESGFNKCILSVNPGRCPTPRFPTWQADQSK